MKIIYDDKVVEISESMIEALKTYAIGYMDAMRACEPDTAWCWNVCRIEFGDEHSCSPTFEYGAEDSDLSTWGGPSFRVEHPVKMYKPTQKRVRRKKSKRK